MRRRVRTEAAAVTVALLLVPLLGACPDGSEGSAAPSSTSPTTHPAPEVPPAGMPLDADDLPKVVSNLIAVGDHVRYYAPGDPSDLELVAVDPTSGRVEWRHDAALPPSAGEVTIDTVVADGITPFIQRTDDGTGYALAGAGGDGEIPWSVPIDRPLGFPFSCEDRICIETAVGPVAVDPASGEHQVGRSMDDLVGLQLSIDEEPSLQWLGHPEGRGGDDILSVPRFSNDGLWTRPFDELLPSDDPTWEPESAIRVGDTWILSAYQQEARGDITYPYRGRHGAMIGIAAADGAPLWHREGLDFCLVAGAEDQVLACNTDVTQESAEADTVVQITSIAALDPATGLDRIVVPLAPYDPTVGGAFAPNGPDRMLAGTPTGIQEIDLAAGTAKPAAPGQVGWCRMRGNPPEVEGPDGATRTVYSRAFGRPCALDGTQLDEPDLLAPIVSGELPPVAGVSTVSVGPWVLWNDSGNLAGVVTEG